MAECGKCGGRMEEGFVIDQGHYGSAGVSTWQSGAPAKSFWTGLKMDKAEQVAGATWRCERCGLLESYARK